MTVDSDIQAEITDILFRGMHIKRFWVGEWLMSKSDVHKTVAVETVMQYLADGTIGVGEGVRLLPQGVASVVALFTRGLLMSDRRSVACELGS